MPLPRLESLRSLVCRLRRGSFGLHRAKGGQACFHACRFLGHRRPSPVTESVPGSSSRGAPPPQSSFAAGSRSAPFEAKLYLPGVFALFAASRVRVHEHLRGFPGPRYVPPTGFLSLTTVSSAHRLDGLIPSRHHVQGSCPFRGFSPSAAPPSSSEGACPPAVQPRSAHRPKSVAMLFGLDFEAFLRARQRFIRFGG